MAKLEPGVEVQYCRFDHPEEPKTRVGRVKTWGRKWVEITTAEGKSEWSTPEHCTPTDSSLAETLKEAQQEQPAPVVDSPKIEAGTEIYYRRYDHPYEPRTRQGIVKEWGRKWVQVTSEDSGRVEWSEPKHCSLTKDSNGPSNDTTAGAGTQHTQSALQQTAEEPSVFTTLRPGSLVEYRWSDRKDAVGGSFFGYFQKYEKFYRRVFVRSIPPYSKDPSVLTLKEHLVTPIIDQPAIDLTTGQRVAKLSQEPLVT